MINNIGSKLHGRSAAPFLVGQARVAMWDGDPLMMTARREAGSGRDLGWPRPLTRVVPPITICSVVSLSTDAVYSWRSLKHCSSNLARPGHTWCMLRAGGEIGNRRALRDGRSEPEVERGGNLISRAAFSPGLPLLPSFLTTRGVPGESQTRRASTPFPWFNSGTG